MAADPLVQALIERFLVRRDAWVVQSCDGRYRARRGRLSPALVSAHLAGRLSLCAYCLGPDGANGPRALWGAFDLDAHAAATQPYGRLAPAPRQTLRALAGELASALGALVGPQTVVCEATGGLGLHVWALLGEPAPAASVLALMDGALAGAGLSAGARIEIDEGIWVERYPKSAALGTGQVGSALRVPFGVHPRGGRRSVAFDPTTGGRRDPLDALEMASGLTSAALAVPLRAIGPAPGAAAPLPDQARPDRPPAPDAWLTYRWAACRLGLSDRTAAPPPVAGEGRGYPVRCLFPSAHAHGDRGAGSAYVLRRGEVQIYGCAVCEGGMAIDTIALVRRVAPGLSFAQALDRCHEIDPLNCPSRSERDASTRTRSPGLPRTDGPSDRRAA